MRLYSTCWPEPMKAAFSHDMGLPLVCPCKIHERTAIGTALWQLSTEPGCRGTIKLRQMMNRFADPSPTEQPCEETEVKRQ